MTDRRWGLALCAVVLTGALPWLAGAGSDRTLVKQLDSEVIALRQRIDLLEKHCGNDQAPPAIYAELVQVYAGTPVVVSRSGNRAILTFQTDDLFAAGSLSVREEAQPWLDLLATSLSVHTELDAIVVGHTDNAPVPDVLRGRYLDAWQWSLGEAFTVEDQLTRRYNIQPNRFTLVARAQWDPVAGNDTPEGRASNRRVAVELFEGKNP